MKKESKKIYYTPQIEKVSAESEASHIAKKQSSAVELATEIVNETAEEHAVEIGIEDTLKQEIPQVRIQVNDLEIKKEKVDTWKREQEEVEIESVPTSKNSFDSSTDLPPNAIPLESSITTLPSEKRRFSQEKINSEIIDLKNEAKYEKKVEEIPEKPTRMRKNPLQSGEIGNLTFSVGKDINDEKKK